MGCWRGSEIDFVSDQDYGYLLIMNINNSRKNDYIPSKLAYPRQPEGGNRGKRVVIGDGIN